MNKNDTILTSTSSISTSSNDNINSKIIRELLDKEISEIKNNINRDIRESDVIFTIFSNLIKKIPGSVKFIFNLLFLLLIIARIIGFENILTNMFYFKLFIIIVSLIPIIYNLINLFVLHLFITNKDMKISVLLPKFVVKWLESIKIFSDCDISISAFKEDSYLDMSIYIVLLLLIVLFI